MDKMSFGEILRQTRERKGLDLNATARRLRIRPDILQAIEDSNFAVMPPRGYARNMVNGYARYLGLNPTEITGMYLDELYAYQVEYESRRMRPTGIEMPSSYSSARAQERSATRSTNRRTYYERDERDIVMGQSVTASPTRGRSSDRSSSRRKERLYPEGRTHQARGSALPSNQYTNFYSGPGPMGFIQANWRYLVAGLIGLIILGLILSQVFSCSRKEEAPVETVPVSNVVSSDVAALTQPKAPTSFTMEYTVESGNDSWIEVYVDEELKVGEAVSGPKTESFTSSDSIQFITANPLPVTVKIDGKQIELQTDDTGVVNMTWNFSDILAQWLADHPGAKAADTTSSSSSSSSASDDASGSGEVEELAALQEATQAQIDTVEEIQADAAASADAAAAADAAAEGNTDNATQTSN